MQKEYRDSLIHLQMSMTILELEQAFKDLYTAIRLSARMGSLYDIDGTAEVIANAVVELAKKRQSKEDEDVPGQT